jgi:hypothetical protein
MFLSIVATNRSEKRRTATTTGSWYQDCESSLIHGAEFKLPPPAIFNLQLSIFNIPSSRIAALRIAE